MNDVAVVCDGQQTKASRWVFSPLVLAFFCTERKNTEMKNENIKNTHPTPPFFLSWIVEYKIINSTFLIVDCCVIIIISIIVIIDHHCCVVIIVIDCHHHTDHN